MKDLVVLVADGQQQAVIETLLVQRHQFFNQSGPGFELAMELKVPKAISSSYKYARYEVGIEKIGYQTLSQLPTLRTSLRLCASA